MGWEPRTVHHKSTMSRDGPQDGQIRLQRHRHHVPWREIHQAPLPRRQQPTGCMLILPPASKRRGPSRRHGLCSHLAHLWATYDSSPRSKAVGTPHAEGLCSRIAHLWATSDSAPRSEAVGTPRGSKGHVATLPTCGPLLILPPALKRWGPHMRKGYVAALPTCGPLVILPAALKRWGLPEAARVM